MKNTKGFTLIELLVVIAIIGVLATGAVTVFTGAQAKARDAARLADLNVLNSATAVFNADNAQYPNNDSKDAYATDLEGSYVQAIPNAIGTNPYYYGTKLVGVGTGTGAITAYEYATDLEHTATGETNEDKVTGDGGNDDSAYEVGSDTAILNATTVGTVTIADDHGLAWDSAGDCDVGDVTLGDAFSATTSTCA